jgi:hypothetical protein
VPDLMHLVLNLLEDVWRYANEYSLGPVSNIDHYADGRFTVSVSTKRGLGEMQLALRKLLRQHWLENQVVVSRVA